MGHFAVPYHVKPYFLREWQALSVNVPFAIDESLCQLQVKQSQHGNAWIHL